MELNAKYKKLYRETAREYLHSMRENISLLSQDPQKGELKKAIYMAAHSLSGQSSVAGYPHIARVSSLIEKIFKAKLEDEVSVFDTKLLHEVGSAVEKMLLSVDEIEKNDKELDLGEEIKKL